MGLQNHRFPVELYTHRRFIPARSPVDFMRDSMTPLNHLPRYFAWLLLSPLFLLSTLSYAESPPNIVLILADDLGWNAVGYRNPRMKTPNLDRLVSEGVELRNFYVAPMCSPTRAGLLTGRYPIRFGSARAVIPPQRDHGLPVSETTLAELLEPLGYQHRGIFGKWHLGHRRTKWHPLNRGFSHFVGHYNGAIDYFDLTREGERDWHQQFSPSDESGYATDLIAKAASDFIRQSSETGTPYFCYVPFNAPHSPFQAPSESIAKFKSMNDIKMSDVKNRRSMIERLQVYAAMIWRMDQGIGRILEAVEQSGNAENTIVWFLSDNGGVGNIWRNNHPLRGSKLTVYEGGIRVPAAVRWPRKISAGTQIHSTVGYIDLLPTLLAATGRENLDNNQLKIDGINLLPLLTQDSSEEDAKKDLTKQKIDERAWFSYHGQQGEHNEHLSVLQNGWKLKVNGPRFTGLDDLKKSGVTHELFYLATDPLEQRDLSQENMETVKNLAKLLVDHRQLQPSSAVPPYNVGKQGFMPPKDWQAKPDAPDKLLGSHDQ